MNKLKIIFNYSACFMLFLLAVVGCEGCLNENSTVFIKAFAPCDVCIAVKMVNRKSGVVTLFDSNTVQTLRNVKDSLVIVRNGIVIEALPNFKQRLDMEDRKHRRYYFQSQSAQGIRTIRFELEHSAEMPLVTSLVMDGEYNPAIDTVDIYYRQR